MDKSEAPSPARLSPSVASSESVNIDDVEAALVDERGVGVTAPATSPLAPAAAESSSAETGATRDSNVR